MFLMLERSTNRGLCETGYLEPNHHLKSAHQTARTSAIEEIVLNSVDENPKINTRQVANNLNIAIF